MNIASAIRFPFRGPHGWANFGLTLVCALIPVVGPIVVMGYLVGVERTLAENIQADPPRFDFGKFTFYLTRGAWPFLVGLVVAVVLVPCMWGLLVVAFLGGIVAQDHLALGLVMVVVGALGFLLVLAVWSVLRVPMNLRAGLQEDFAAGFSRRFLADYLRRVGLLTLGIELLMLLIITPVAVASVCLFFVGPMVLAALMPFIRAHIDMQLYQEYLARGGTPIPMKPEAPPSAFPVMPPRP